MCKTIAYILCTLLFFKCIYGGYNDSEWKEKPIYQLDMWFNQLNYEYKILSYYSEFYKWEINVKLQKNLQNDFNELILYFTNWKRKKCMEAKNYKMTKIQQRMIFILCRVPNYSNFELKEVLNILEKIKENYRETHICLLKNFNICANPLRIWNFTNIYCKEELIYSVDSPRKSVLSENTKISNVLSRFEDHQKYQLSCIGIDPDLKVIINGKFSKNDCEYMDDIMLRWTWVSSRLALNQEIDFAKAFKLMNKAAIENGYDDIGQFWREELEMQNLDQSVNHLWSKIKKFYQLLHGVLRNVLFKKYSKNTITEYGPLPAHLLGSLSLANWEAYLDLLMPYKKINLDTNFSKTNWTTLDKVKKIEDFYASFGLSRMSKNFWKNSNLSSTGNDYNCRDNFANMYDGYRLNVCADQSLNDFYKIAYQMGYIEYNMQYSNQSALFQSPTNLAFAEAIGGVVVLGMISPQHLNRLTLLPDKFLYPNRIPSQIYESNLSSNFNKIRNNIVHLENTTGINDPNSNYFLNIIQIDSSYQYSKYKKKVSLNDFDISLLFKMALTKIPKISFEYVLDRVRWDLLSDKVNFEGVNAYFWQLINQQMGIYPQSSKNQPYFIDYTVKFHITNNIPYIPYLLSSFLEVQIFKGLCEYTIYGRFNSGKKIPMPLHRCDIYGSKRAGRLLKKALRLGSSVHWSETLYILTGQTEISAIPLLEYYEPLIMWLEKNVIKNDIPLGW